MKCFSFPHSERRARDSKHRFSWGFFTSHGSAPEVRSPPQIKQQALSEPCREPFGECPAPTLGQSSSQRPADLRVFSYSELRAATKNFSRANILGEGGFGYVYKGIIKHQNANEPEPAMEVAVKQLNRKGQQGHKEWLAEVRFLGMVEHSNLVKLVGYCAEDDERGIQRLLVYEYMVNGSLEDHLFQRGPSVLSWHQRLHIILGAACGLAYLHEEINGIQVIFRDFKTSNVLLDKDFTPKLSDFGLARQGPEVGNTHVSTAVVGTLGYAAPEYIQTGHLTAKSDVWSFGMVLLEMLSGRRSVDRNRPKNEQQLLDWVKPYLQGGKKVHLIMDPRLQGQYSLLQAQRIASLALECLGKHQRTRPLMSLVVEKLNEIMEPFESEGPPSSPSLRSSSSTGNLKDTAKANSGDTTDVKRRRLSFRDVISFKSRDESWLTWRAWAPKTVKV